MGMEEFRDNMRDFIVQHQMHRVLSVFPDQGADPITAFSYTIGLKHLKDQPELLIVGLIGEDAMWLLNELAKRMPEGGFGNGEEISFGGAFPVRLYECVNKDAWDKYCIQAGIIQGAEEFRIQQVLLCDKWGNFPPKCREPYSKQPLLFLAQ